MALGITERLRIIFDVETQSFKQGVKSLKADLAAADGMAGKAKVGFAALGTQLSQYGAQAALAAGAAFMAFGVKSVQSFQQSALAAGEFSDRTGTSVEDASRWIAVADDFGIAGTAVQTAFQRMNLAIEGNKFEKYGLDVTRAADGTLDANATFLATATEIGKIPDAAKRAEAAQAIFGKSWGDISRLMRMDSVALANALENVSDAQITDQDELSKAQRLQAAMDDLGDSVLDVQLALGEALVPMIADAAEKFSDLKRTADDFSDVADKIPFSDLADDANDFLNPIDEMIQGFSALTEKGDTWGQRLGNVGKMIPFVGEVIDRLGDKFGWYGETLDASGAGWDALIQNTKDATTETGDLGDEFGNAEAAATPYVSKIEALAERLEAVKTAEEELRDSRKSAADASRDLEAAVDGYQDSLVELDTVQGDVKSSAEDVETANRNAGDAAIAMAEAYAEQQIASGNAKDANTLQIESLGYVAATLAPGSPLRRQLEAYIALLEGIPRNIPTTVTVNQEGTVDFNNGGSSAQRPVAGGGSATMAANGITMAAISDWVDRQNAEPTTSAADKQRKRFDREFAAAKVRYERGTYTAEAYLAELRRLQAVYKWRKHSEPGMALWREIQRVNKEIREAAADAAAAAADNIKDAGDPRDPWQQAAANQAAAQASQNLSSTISSSFADLTDRDPSNDARALDAWADAIWRDIEARADQRFDVKGRRWAEFARRELEAAITANPPLASRLRVYLLGVPTFGGGADGAIGGLAGTTRPPRGAGAGTNSAGGMRAGGSADGVTLVINAPNALTLDRKGAQAVFDQFAPLISKSLAKYRNGAG